ncbi:MAG: EamA family transporter RarD [Oscillospiraceae bacterium]|nr:EamA family transporter RarD [Oscillospiraceae bacterium]
MSTSKRGLIIALLCYLLWGVLPPYWNLLIGVDPLLILCSRVVFACLFMLIVLPITRRTQVFLETLKDKLAMRWLIPASVLIAINWGLFIWAVNTGRVLEASLGYYMNPLLAVLIGSVMFREKCTKLQYAAVALAFTGLLISVIAYGSFPIVSVSLAISFGAYGAIKKKAQADPIASIAIESMLMTPFALIFAFVFMTGDVLSVSLTQILLMLGGGAATAVPLVLYSRAINDIPFTTVGFLQYISPSMALIYALFTGEIVTAPRLVSFIFTWLGLAVFSIALIRIAKSKHPAREVG